MATLRPWSCSSRANFSTTGVLPVPPDGEIADGDDLHAEGGIAEDAVVDQPAVNFKSDLVQLGTNEQQRANDGSAGPAALSGDHFFSEAIQILHPDAPRFSHVKAVCQARESGARGRKVKVFSFKFSVSDVQR